MTDQNEISHSFTAFVGQRRLITGTLAEIAREMKSALRADRTAAILVFDDETGKTVELDVRGTRDEVVKRYTTPSAPPDPARAGPGRPKLGVVCREISLLPRHWQWLSTQPGGASVTLRKLVEEARKKNSGQDKIRLAREAVYKFISVMAGDLVGYEESLRALYANNRTGFKKLITAWPKDIARYAEKLAAPAFVAAESGTL